MKKEYYLTISRKDRIYLVIFVSILLGWELIKLFIPFPTILQNENSVTITANPGQPDSVTFSNNEKQKTGQDNMPGNTFEEEAESTPVEKTPVPIMSATVDQLISIGFSRKVAFTIQKYINAGGQVKDEKSLRKIYGIDTVELQNILPLITFPAAPEPPDSTTTKNKKWTATIFDLNEASVEDLESLNGIGTVLADRIIKFRTALGGFTSVNQIKECYGLSEETFQLIQSRLTIIQPVQQFSINTLDPKTFSHPYLNKKILWMLPSYIKNHGPITNEEDLKKVFPPDSNWCNKLLPYLKF
jgi:competence ComEA-like helix-hairpin-helix protein